jgi:hypothetical protein
MCYLSRNYLNLSYSSRETVETLLHQALTPRLLASSSAGPIYQSRVRWHTFNAADLVHLAVTPWCLQSTNSASFPGVRCRRSMLTRMRRSRRIPASSACSGATRGSRAEAAFADRGRVQRRHAVGGGGRGVAGGREGSDRQHGGRGGGPRRPGVWQRRVCECVLGNAAEHSELGAEQGPAKEEAEHVGDDI